jgi:GNAT superfamily N-acetyltransferase
MIAEIAPEREHEVLDDGTGVDIRPIQPDDVPRLQAFHARLSPETVYARFLGVHPALSFAEAEHLAYVDYSDRIAIVATRVERGEDVIIGIAGYDRLGPGQVDQAEAAVVVEDRYQRRGLGRILLLRLADYALDHGVRTLVAELGAANDWMVEVIRRSGRPLSRTYNGSVCLLHVRLG